MKVEHELRIIPIDENFDGAMEKMKADGWRPSPGFQAIAIFPIVRDESTIAEEEAASKVAGFGGQMGGHIDDSKVFVIRSEVKK